MGRANKGTRKAAGRGPSSDVKPDALADLLLPFILAPKTLNYVENHADGVKADKLLKLKDMWNAVHDTAPSLSFKKTTVKRAFVLVREKYGKAWKLGPEHTDAWATSMTTRFRLMARHLKNAETKGTIWMVTHFKAWLKAPPVASTVQDGEEVAANATSPSTGPAATPDAGAVVAEAGGDSGGDDDDEDDEDSEDEELEAAEGVADPNGAGATAEEEFQCASPFAPPVEWEAGWDPEMQYAWRKRGKVYEVTSKVAPPDDGCEDAVVMAVFETADGPEYEPLKDITCALWNKMLEAGTAGQPQAPKYKTPPDMQTQDGATLMMKVRSVNKIPHYCFFEGKQQILQQRIGDFNDDTTYNVLHALMLGYANGDIAKVELRARKLEAFAKCEKEVDKAGKAKATEAVKDETAQAKAVAAPAVKNDPDGIDGGKRAPNVKKAKKDGREDENNTDDKGKLAAAGAETAPTVGVVKATAASSHEGGGGAPEAAVAPAAAAAVSMASVVAPVATGPQPRTPKRKRDCWELELSDSDSDDNPFSWA